MIDRMAKLRAGFLTTRACGPDGIYELNIKFQNLEDLDAADQELRSAFDREEIDSKPMTGAAPGDGPVAWMDTAGDIISDTRKRLWVDQDGGYRISAQKFTQPLYAAPGAAIAARDQEALTNDNFAADWLTNRAPLHPHTINLVVRFARALAGKLAAAEKKYGYSDGWLSPDWMDECRTKLQEHIAKGDPRDVAAYCAFLWHHGESTASPAAAPTSQPNATEFSELMAMPEEQIDTELRSLGIDPEDAARKVGDAIASAVEIAEQMRIAKKGATCPLCGRNFPHEHSPEEITIYRNGMKAARTSQPNAAAQEQQAGWLPIESAPKDGTNVLLTNGINVAQGWWEHVSPYIHEKRDVAGVYHDQEEHDGFDGWLDCEGGMQPDPTHYMLLPPAPAPTGMGSVSSPSVGKEQA
ncbi:hypothetical protein J2W34_000090 [Variovorax boronicumulans]|uniref:hypothetical protein n=1 Tax=Variovorax boronicumulans TaxID=436515 RepID=UPI002784B798|nr:hypothetical protein [Variovorax boronicumulans]MDQ0068316.1 hypothetical protein [Variovorax boronicumulans]